MMITCIEPVRTVDHDLLVVYFHAWVSHWFGCWRNLLVKIRETV